MVEDEVHQRLAEAIGEAADAERTGVPARLDQGAIGWLAGVLDWWPHTEASKVAFVAIGELRDPVAIPLLAAFLSGVPRLPDDCRRYLPYRCVEAAVAIRDDPGCWRCCSPR